MTPAELEQLLQRGAGQAPGEPQVTSLLRRARSRRLRRRLAAASSATALLTLVVFLGTSSDETQVVLDGADGTALALPPQGEVSPEWLPDGTPVFVVAGEGRTATVVEAISTHDAYMPDKMVVWCASANVFQDPYHHSEWGPTAHYHTGPALTALATYTAEVEGDHVLVGSREAPLSREQSTTTPHTGPLCDWPEYTTSESPSRGHGVRHTPTATPWPVTTPEDMDERSGPVVITGTVVYDGDGTGRICSSPSYSAASYACPESSPRISQPAPRLHDTVHTGTFLVVLSNGEPASLLAFGDVRSNFREGAPRP